MILKHCDGKKEEIPGSSKDESPLTSFSLLMSPTRQADTTQKDSEETTTRLILPDDLPIDLRVKIVVCLIYLRKLHLIKVHFDVHCLCCFLSESVIVCEDLLQGILGTF